MTRIRRDRSSPHYNQFQRYTTKEHRNSILKLRCKSKRRECRVSLEEYFGGGYGTLTYTGVEVDPVYESALGITSLSVNGGYLLIRCDKRGSGKVRVKAIAGGSYAGGAGGTGGTSIEREISILSRGISGWNNGWL